MQSFISAENTVRDFVYYEITPFINSLLKETPRGSGKDQLDSHFRK